MFCSKADLLHAGGFDESLPIMEDADLCIRMHEAGPVAACPVVTAQCESGPSSNSRYLRSAEASSPDELKRHSRRRGHYQIVSPCWLSGASSGSGMR